jgi:hypothetical protein
MSLLFRLFSLSSRVVLPGGPPGVFVFNFDHVTEAVFER